MPLTMMADLGITTRNEISCASSWRTKQRSASAVALLTMLSKSLNQTSIEELTIL